MSSSFKTSGEWVAETGIKILDPDGWDRDNFENSWAEQITLTKFLHRCNMSTIDMRTYYEFVGKMR